MVEMGVKGEVKTTILPLEPLRQVKVVKGTLEEVLKESCKDYVTVILTDKADLDVIDMQERIRLAFPNLLEIRRENQRKTDYTRTLQTEELLDPYELCRFFPERSGRRRKDDFAGCTTYGSGGEINETFTFKNAGIWLIW